MASAEMVSLYLVRHGETQWNRKQRLQGHRDIPLNAAGRHQSATLIGRLAHVGLARAVSSPLQRSVETGAIAARGLGLAPLVLDEGLIERDYGRAEGTTPEDRFAEFGSATEFPGSESLRRVERRAIDALVRIATDAEPVDNVLVVTHSAVIRQVLRHIAPRSSVAEAPIGNASITVIDRDPAGRWRIGPKVRSPIRLGCSRDHN